MPHDFEEAIRETQVKQQEQLAKVGCLILWLPWTAAAGHSDSYPGAEDQDGYLQDTRLQFQASTPSAPPKGTVSYLHVCCACGWATMVHISVRDRKSKCLSHAQDVFDRACTMAFFSNSLVRTLNTV